MTNNLPAVQKTNWVDNDIVRPVHTNGWGEAINTLSEDLPIYASTGNYYNATMQGSNVYVLAPANIEGVSNETVSEYLDGMTVVFKCPTTNSGAVYVNVDSLGVKSIKSSSNTDLTASTLIAGSFVKLIYDKVNGYFKYEQDTSKANISLNNLSSAGLGVINTTIDTKITTILNALYPIGSIYIGTQSTCPLETLGVGTWALVGADRTLQGSSTNHAANTTVSASLPTLITDSKGKHKHDKGTMNIRGYLADLAHQSAGASISATGCFSVDKSGGTSQYGYATNISTGYDQIEFDAADNWTGYTSEEPNHTHNVTWSGHVGSTVQPDAYVVNIWRRTA